MPLIASFIGILCVLFGGGACIWAAVASTNPLPRRLAKWALFLWWASSFSLALLEDVVERDWVHMFWMAQIPCVVAFLLSGALLVTTTRKEGIFDDDMWNMPFLRIVTRLSSPWWFLAMLASLALLSLVVLEFPSSTVGARNLGQPTHHLIQLAHWGFGGSLPDCLTPLNESEVARGVGHLMREVTVPLGTLLIAAWLWIAYCALAVIGQFVPGQRMRRAFLLTAPLIGGIVFLVATNSTNVEGSVFDTHFFQLMGARDTGIWTSDPVVMKSFGPVMATALFFGLLLALVQRLPARAGRNASPAELVPSLANHACGVPRDE